MNIIELEKSIVQVFSDHVDYSYVYPWSMLKKSYSTGSGFCINIKDFNGDREKSEKNKDKFIITNAHCVHNATHITVRKRGSSQLFRMRIDAIVYECDLAILSVDPGAYIYELKTSTRLKKYKNLSNMINSFWDDIPALSLGGIPNKLDKVYVYGYPLAGDNISVTKGVVNRIKVMPYSHMVHGIAIQIDAPINFGNSGGPVLNSQGKVVGVAFSGEDDSMSQNMGYIIPTILVQYVIDILSIHKSFTGLCHIGVYTQNLSNSAIQNYYKIDGHEGVVVQYVEKLGPSYGILKKGDVITKIDDISVRNDGTVLLQDVIINAGENIKELPGDVPILQSDDIVSFLNIINLKKPGNVIKIDIIRNGRLMKTKIRAHTRKFLIPILEYQLNPSYFIVAGLVFIPLSLMFIAEKHNHREKIDHLITALETSEMTREDEQIIVLSQIFNTELTEGFTDSNDILNTVNDEKIINLAHLHHVISAELKKSEYIVFRFLYIKLELILKSDDIRKYHRKILIENLGHDNDYIASL